MLALWVALIGTASADCMSGSLSVFPASGTALPAKGQIVLEAYGTERAAVEALMPEDLALVQGKQRIDLRVFKTFHGSFTDDQAVLVPQTAPGPGPWRSRASRSPSGRAASTPSPHGRSMRSTPSRPLGAAPRRSS